MGQPIPKRRVVTIKISNLDEVIKILKPAYKWDREYSKVLFLDSNLDLIEIFEVPFDISTKYEVSFNPYVIFSRAKKINAKYLILSHSHPFSNAIGSSLADIKATRNMIAMAKRYKLKVLDHIILSQNWHLSLREDGTFSALSEN